MKNRYVIYQEKCYFVCGISQDIFFNLYFAVLPIDMLKSLKESNYILLNELIVKHSNLVSINEVIETTDSKQLDLLRVLYE